MARFEIVIEDENRYVEPSKPWNAAVFPIDDDGKSEDLVAVGVGTTPKQAVRDLLSRWSDEDGASDA